MSSTDTTRGSGETMRKPTALVVDDATFIREAFPVLMPQLDVRGAFPTAEALLVSRRRADVVVLELQEAQKCPVELRAGMAALRTLTRAGYAVCVYTQEQRPFVHAACLASGAVGVVSKSAPSPLAQDAFVDVANGGTEFPPELLARIQQLSERGGLGLLSPRKRQIFAARARGMSITAIAATLLDEPEALAVEEWHITGRLVREFLSYASLAMISRQLGLDPEDFADIWPIPFTDTIDEPHYGTLDTPAAVDPHA
ncbi:response regulator [Cumulibacter manganitolerans]|uniref:response regulator transcription factor n=1 Tax=Cumulibacter manganitolerans TaxID=1884992 RepID=UPI001295CADF|nr:response regulator transcription factor [Cumulibacter manganitolerans]